MLSDLEVFKMEVNEDIYKDIFQEFDATKLFDRELESEQNMSVNNLVDKFFGYLAEEPNEDNKKIGMMLFSCLEKIKVNPENLDLDNLEKLGMLQTV